MKNTYFRVLLGVVASALFATTASASLLVNGSFEDTPFAGAEEIGAGVGWSTFGNVFRVQQAGGGCDPVSCAGPLDGTVALKAFGEAGVFQDFAASEGQQYAGSVWAINPMNADVLVGGQIAGVNIEWLDAGGNNISTEFGSIIDSSTTQDVWTQLTVAGAAPAGTAFARFVLITGPFAGDGSGGAPRWDSAEFSLVPIPGALLFMGSGLLGLLGFSRKKAA